VAYSATITLANFAAVNQTFTRVNYTNGVMVFRNTTSPSLQEYLFIRKSDFNKTIAGSKVPYVRYNLTIERKAMAKLPTKSCKTSLTYEMPLEIAGSGTVGTDTSQASDLIDGNRYLYIGSSGNSFFQAGYADLAVTP